MALYPFRCRNEHVTEEFFPMNAVPGAIACHCGAAALRDFLTVARSLQVVTDDPFRRAWLSDKFSQAMVEQGRAPDPLMPKDKHEAQDRLRTHGRLYVGDDHSKLEPRGRKSIEKAKRDGAIK